MGEGGTKQPGEENSRKQPEKAEQPLSTDVKADYKADYKDLSRYSDNLEGFFNERNLLKIGS